MDSLLAGGLQEESVSLPSGTSPLNEEALEEQAAFSSVETTQPALLDRISNAKVYLLSDSTQTKTAKRKRTDIEEDEDVDMDEDSTLRSNALFLTGTPISHLPTARIFAYVTHFDAQPIGLEWVNDSSCVLVFESKSLARAAHRRLQRTAAEDQDNEGYIAAKSIPITFWLPEDRISKSLGQGEGLKGTIKMRWAKNDDVKKKGSMNESEFYKKYGKSAGKDGDLPQKRRRDERLLLDASMLDEDLDAYLGKERRTSCSPPPNSDQLTDNMSLIGRTSLSERVSGTRRLHEGDKHGDSRQPRGRGRRNPQRHKTQKELDDELDAFLNEKD